MMFLAVGVAASASGADIAFCFFPLLQRHHGSFYEQLFLEKKKKQLFLEHPQQEVEQANTTHLFESVFPRFSPEQWLLPLSNHPITTSPVTLRCTNFATA